MPFRSKSQKRLFYAAANNPKIAKKTGLSKEVAEKFIEDSQGETEPKVERFTKLKKKLGAKK